MLTELEIEAIEAEFENYERKQAAVVEALKIVQRRRGWLTAQLLDEVADLLEMSVEEVGAVATFYNLIFLKPVGRHVILVCNSVSCWIMGNENVLRHLERRLGVELGETTADGRFTLLPTVCLGACHQAPAMMVDDDLHPHLDPEKIDTILESYR
jgi:NADH-quinone oxidoreductase subunit E